jgi:CRISPR-associated endonuclease/helicase Cas3
MDFATFFRSASCGQEPRPYQIALARDPWPETRIVPTGFGKTAAVLGAWSWKIAQQDPHTPRRLVYCLPMRTLVEQTEGVAKAWIEAALQTFGLSIELDVLMGGRSDGRRTIPNWMLHPDRPAILIGTQDLLVSAALMRGYGATRYRWPVDFALLHNDALWVFDEVQLTGAALTTSAQIEGFRRMFGIGRNSRTLWMSATLDPAWLQTVDFAPADEYRPHDLDEVDLAQTEHLWRAKKRLQRLDSPTNIGKEELKAYAIELAKRAIKKAKPSTNTIMFLNTVVRAQAVFDALKHSAHKCEMVLVHSRFRKADRDQLIERLRADAPAEGRIVVATQALEAGVDVTSTALITEIAPWSSLVQRFGRCNRYGECGETGADIFWVDLPDTVEAAKPYVPEDFANARKALQALSSCGPSDLTVVPPSVPPRGAVIRKRDLFGLFDTDPDLSGADTDVSPYVRDADDTDARVFWRVLTDAKAGPQRDEARRPHRDEICAVRIGQARRWLKDHRGQAFTWDAIGRRWSRPADLWPGVLVLVDAAVGGYDSVRGFDVNLKAPVAPVEPEDNERAPPDGYDEDAETLKDRCVPLPDHLRHVRDEAARLCKALEVSSTEAEAVITAGLWHDVGKSHDVFKSRCGLEPDAAPLAKTPNYNWRIKDLRECGNGGKKNRNRRYFRHELASALAWLRCGTQGESHDLIAYLIAAHHGKVRMGLRALPDERGPEDSTARFARGVWDGDRLAAFSVDGLAIPETELALDVMELGGGESGQSWAARTLRLLEQYGPFRLAFLEALVRIADWRASEAEQTDGGRKGGGA